MTVSFALGYEVRASLAYRPNASGDLKPLVIRENSPEYHYINPLLLNESSRLPSLQYADLQRNIESYVLNAKAQGAAKDVSVYLRDLNSGKWTGVNENDTYAPASMLKVAVLIAYLKKAEEKIRRCLKRSFRTSPRIIRRSFISPRIPWARALIPCSKFSSR